MLSQSLGEKGVGDINSGKYIWWSASIGGTVDLTKPWNIVKWYYIIDPTTNVITGNTVNDAITTQAVAETLPSGATSGSAASGSTIIPIIRNIFMVVMFLMPPVFQIRAVIIKLRLAYSKATIGPLC